MALFFLVMVNIIAFIAIVLIRNRLYRVQLKKLDQQVQKLIASNYSEKVSVNGDKEVVKLSENINKLSDVVHMTQENLEQETKRLSSILSNMTDGVLATDRLGRIIESNQMARKLLNRSEEELAEQSIVDILGISDRYVFNDLIEKTPEITVESLDEYNDLVTIKVHFALIPRASGFISGLVVVLHDMTEQEREERERRLFVSNVSHELRTPLTSVKSYLEALDDGALNDPIAPNFIKVSLDETNRMIRMISDLLSLSRSDNGTIKLDVELTNFTAFVTFILNRFDQMNQQQASIGKEKRYEIVRDYALTPIWLEIDTDKMTQVIDNIMNNAIKYSPDGGRIDFKMKTTDTQVIVTISDEGLGIPKKDLPKIFERFYRVDKARSRAQGGTGLGLSIAKEIVKQHDGFIWAKSEEGKGSTFTIVLPYDKNATLDSEWDEE